MKRFRILLVEDQTAVREITTQVLRTFGYEVIEAATGADGIKLAKAHQVDAVVIDLGLPDMSGKDVAKVLNHLPIAILTGDSDNVVVPEAAVILQKPLYPGQLHAALQELLARSNNTNPPESKVG
jgi:two-component system, OmpR family, KDP operon response regulator KdpE